jgi:murein DD-endopeptidase MepM/ murein hydrolase activator NlpD
LIDPIPRSQTGWYRRIPPKDVRRLIRRLVFVALVTSAVLGACSSAGRDRLTSTLPAALPVSTLTIPSPAAVVVSTTSAPPAVKDAVAQCLELAIFGDPAESLYLLPFPVGEGYSILQSYCADDGSHERQLAYDFLMPIGSAVHASRDGIVFEVKEDALDNTGTKFFNYIFVEHIDGTLGFYAHLTHEGSLVEVGDHVAAGDLIGVSGASGRTHEFGVLHFGVIKPMDGSREVEIPVVFGNGDGPLDSRGGLREGSFYRALPDPCQS